MSLYLFLYNVHHHHHHKKWGRQAASDLFEVTGGCHWFSHSFHALDSSDLRPIQKSLHSLTMMIVMMMTMMMVTKLWYSKHFQPDVTIKDMEGQTALHLTCGSSMDQVQMRLIIIMLVKTIVLVIIILVLMIMVRVLIIAVVMIMMGFLS